MGLGADFIASVLTSGDVGEFLGLHPSESLFLPTEAETFRALLDHVSKYGKIPSEKALMTACGGDADLSEDAEDSPKYYYDLIRQRFIAQSLTAAMMEAQAILKSGGTDVGTEGYAQLLAGLAGISKVQTQDQVIDLREAAEVYMAAYLEKFHVMHGGEGTGVKFGWPALDYGSIGLNGGDVVSYVGRPSLGKTWMLLYTAHHAWMTQGKGVAFVTLEMSPQLIMDRFMALDAGLGIKHVMNATLMSEQVKKMGDKLFNVYPEHEKPFYIVDGNMAATVSDLVQIFRHQKVDVVFIDGAYMLKNDDPRLGKYAKVGENVEMIKKEIAHALDIPVICSYQFNREVPKKKAKKGGGAPQQVGLEDIGYSDAIGQFSSIVIGLFEDDSVETMVSRKMEVMKNRHGPVPVSFRVHWDMTRMDFSEWDDSLEQKKAMEDT
jgi:replicative DNA helicase